MERAARLFGGSNIGELRDEQDGFAEEMNAPDAASHAKKDERAAKSIVEWAVENQMKLNQKYATTVPRHPRFDPLPLMPSGAQLALGANEPRQEPPADLV